MNKIRIIIAGSRTFNNYGVLSNIVDHILRTQLLTRGYKLEEIEIICGLAKGADSLGKMYALSNGLDIKYFPADWQHLGKSAGCIRNRQMAEYASYKKGYGALIAFWDGESKGTKNMIDTAKEYGLKTYVYNYINRNSYTI